MTRSGVAWAARTCAVLMALGALSCRREPERPRLIAPLAGVRIPANGTLRWRLPAGSEGGTVELCADRACRELVMRLDATAGELRVPPGLAGRRLFWRVVTGRLSSATWAFRANAGSEAPLHYSGDLSDVNGDGFDDLWLRHAIVDETGRGPDILVLFCGSASGLVECSQRRAVSPESRLDVLGDLDGDGYADALFRVEDPDVSLGMFWPGGARPQRPGAPIWADAHPGFALLEDALLPAADLDGDGLDDALRVRVLEAKAGPGPGPRLVRTARVLGGRALPLLRELRAARATATGHAPVAVADLDGDGVADLIGDADGCSVSFSRSGAEEPRPVALPGDDCASPGGGQILAGDFTGDGHTDLAVVLPSPARRLRLLVGPLGDAAAHVPAAPIFPAQGGVEQIAAGDFDGDGAGDLALGHRAADETFSVMIVAGGAGGLRPQLDRPLHAPARPGLSVAELHAGDVNGDGYSDLVLGGDSGGAGHLVAVYLGGPGGLSREPAAILEPSFIRTALRW